MNKQTPSPVQLTGERVGSCRRRCAATSRSRRTTIGRSAWGKGDRPVERNFVRSVAAVVSVLDSFNPQQHIAAAAELDTLCVLCDLIVFADKFTADAETAEAAQRNTFRL